MTLEEIEADIQNSGLRVEITYDDEWCCTISYQGMCGGVGYGSSIAEAYTDAKEERQKIFDADGYPTDRIIKTIANWSYKDPVELMKFVESCWRHPELVYTDEVEDGVEEWTLHTAGWGGNEDLIGALQQNTMFWALNWYQSTRGGKFVFRLKVTKPKEE